MKYDVTTTIECRLPGGRFVSEFKGDTPYLAMQQLAQHLNIDQMLSFSRWLLEAIKERDGVVGGEGDTDLREAVDALDGLYSLVDGISYAPADRVLDKHNRECRESAAQAEVAAIHHAMLNPMEVVYDPSESWTVRTAKEFILKAVGK